jgi:hypothetical protein
MIELHVLIPGRPAELVARVLDGRLNIVPPATPVPVAQPCTDLPPPAEPPA